MRGTRFLVAEFIPSESEGVPGVRLMKTAAR